MHRPNTSDSSLIKRKQLAPSSSPISVNNAAAVISPTTKQPDLVKIRLKSIAIKCLTLIELKYLKQICFNKLKSQLELLSKEQHHPNHQQQQHTPLANSTNRLNQSQITTAASSSSSSTSAANFKLISIPKDESMKMVKAKNIGSSASRSKSVDFRFALEEIKENYLFRRSNRGGGGGESAEHNLVFGQSLYKCILNDLSHSSAARSRSKNLSGGGKKSKSNSSVVNSNPNKVLIASKNDMDVLNVISQNPNVTTQSTRVPGSSRTCLTNIDNLTADLMVNKRNSVLFEALDLKNAPQSSSTSGHQSKIGHRFLNFNKSSGSNSMGAIKEEKTNVVEAMNNQNLSIRCEGLVPNIVKSCCNHINERGLDLVGIFRIDSSKKRIKEVKFK